MEICLLQGGETHADEQGVRCCHKLVSPYKLNKEWERHIS